MFLQLCFCSQTQERGLKSLVESVGFGAITRIPILALKFTGPVELIRLLIIVLDSTI